MIKDCKVSLLGYGMTGWIRAVAYEAVARYFPSCPVKPVLNEVYCASDGEAQAAAASGLKVNLDLDKTIKNSETDLVDICLPPQKRYAATKTAFESGKHVFREKPLWGSLLDAYKMAELAAQYPNQLASVDYTHRHSPTAIYARKLLQEGRFGKALEVVCSYPQSWGASDAPDSSLFDDERGALADLGSYALDMLYFLTGMRPIEVLGCKGEREILSEEVLSIKKTRPERVVEPDDAITALFKLPGGAIGSFRFARNACETEDTHNFVVDCENGALRWNYDNWYFLELYDARTPERGWVRVISDRKEIAYSSFVEGNINICGELPVYTRYEILRKLSGLPEIAPIATFADALEVERTIEAIRRSWKERRWVKLSEITRPEE